MTAPAHAAKVWLHGDRLMVEFPSTLTDKVHEISVPNTPTGLTAALSIFKARNATSTVGTKGSPTKVQVEKDLEKMTDDFLKADRKVKRSKEQFTPELRAGVKDMLKGLGLI